MGTDCPEGGGVAGTESGPVCPRQGRGAVHGQGTPFPEGVNEQTNLHTTNKQINLSQVNHRFSPIYCYSSLCITDFFSLLLLF